MKVLLLNPHAEAQQALVKNLQAKGYAVLLPANAEEAWQMLRMHGTSVDLAVVHRESAPGQDNEQGLKFVSKFKGDAAQADLPFIVTSHVWGDAEFARHQDGEQGANAYLRWPFDASDLLALIQAVFGESTPEAPAAAAPKAPPALRAGTGSISGSFSMGSTGSTGSGDLVLEDASSLFGRLDDSRSQSDTSIHLEAPDVEFERSSPSIAGTRSGSLATEPEPEATVVRPSKGQGTGGSDLVSISGAEAIELSLGSFDPPAAPESEGSQPESLSLSVALSQASMAMAGDQDAAASGAEAVEEPEPAASPSFDGATVVRPGGGFADIVIENVTEAGPQGRSQAESHAEPQADSQAAEQMPYLFGGGVSRNTGPSAVFEQPLGDAVVPGGAAQSPDVETLKKYLLLREQDVAVLSTQLKASKDQIATLEKSLHEERGRNVELGHVASERERKLADIDKEHQQAVDCLQGEVTELRFQLKARADKARILESQVREATEEMERLKERVRSDIRKIRVREKELENRLEISRKDSEALISAREGKIIELKRKLDLLEFNMDLLQDQHAREKENAVKLRERLAKAAQVVRVAGGLLDSQAAAPGGNDDAA